MRSCKWKAWETEAAYGDGSVQEEVSESARGSGEAEEESRYGENGGAVARAVAGERPL
jgi:hypothetical protein